ncbi:MAG: hypothetical protein ACRDRH_26735, partial [Pseudonocardia sp.]
MASALERAAVDVVQGGGVAGSLDSDVEVGVLVVGVVVVGAVDVVDGGVVDTGGGIARGVALVDGGASGTAGTSVDGGVSGAELVAGATVRGWPVPVSSCPPESRKTTVSTAATAARPPTATSTAGFRELRGSSSGEEFPGGATGGSWWTGSRLCGGPTGAAAGCTGRLTPGCPPVRAALGAASEPAPTGERRPPAAAPPAAA